MGDQVEPSVENRFSHPTQNSQNSKGSGTLIFYVDESSRKRSLVKSRPVVKQIFINSENMRKGPQRRRREGSLRRGQTVSKTELLHKKNKEILLKKSYSTTKLYDSVNFELLNDHHIQQVTDKEDLADKTFNLTDESEPDFLTKSSSENLGLKLKPVIYDGVCKENPNCRSRKNDIWLNFHHDKKSVNNNSLNKFKSLKETRNKWKSRYSNSRTRGGSSVSSQKNITNKFPMNSNQKKDLNHHKELLSNQKNTNKKVLFGKENKLLKFHKSSEGFKVTNENTRRISQQKNPFQKLIYKDKQGCNRLMSHIPTKCKSKMSLISQKTQTDNVNSSCNSGRNSGTKKYVLKWLYETLSDESTDLISSQRSSCSVQYLKAGTDSNIHEKKGRKRKGESLYLCRFKDLRIIIWHSKLFINLN